MGQWLENVVKDSLPEINTASTFLTENPAGSVPGGPGGAGTENAASTGTDGDGGERAGAFSKLQAGIVPTAVKERVSEITHSSGSTSAGLFFGGVCGILVCALVLVFCCCSPLQYRRGRERAPPKKLVYLGNTASPEKEEAQSSRLESRRPWV